MNDPRDAFYQLKLQEAEPDDRSACSVLLGLMQTFDSVNAVLSNHLESFGLSMSAFNLLTILEKEEKQSMPLHEIGRLLVTSRANVTGLMDSLSKRGYVERVPSLRDRRIKLARLLPAGKRIIDQVVPEQMNLIHKVSTRLDEPSRAALVVLLKHMRFGALAIAPPQLATV